MANQANLDISLTNYNQRTGRYNLATTIAGDVQMDDTQAYAVQTAVGCVRGAWWADVTVGSDLSRLRSLTSRTPAAATTMVQEALDSLVALGKIAADPVVSPPQVVKGFSNALSIDVAYTTPGGAEHGAAFQLT